MDWAETSRLSQILAADPSSAIAAALLGWEHPVSQEFMALKALHDRTLDAHFKRPQTGYLPAPWDRPVRHGETSLSRAEVLSVLAAERGLPDNWTEGGRRD